MQTVQTKLKELWGKVAGFFKKLNKKTLILLGVCLVVVLAVIIAVALRMNRKEYVVLYSGLNSTETSTVITYLTDKGVTDYRIQGDKILVQSGREDQLRADLIMSGYLTTGFNYEVLNDLSGIATEQERKEAVRIATVQKLEATIRLFRGVQNATVDITTSSDRVYILQDSVIPATAAVTITTETNEPLDSGVVKAIRNTVSHSVKQLDISDVSIVDTNGNVYSDGDAIAKSNQATALKIQHEDRINNSIRSQILQTLGPIYGKDNIHVGVNSVVDVNRRVVEKTEHYQPEGSVDGGGLVIGDHLFTEVIRDGTTPTGGTVGTTTNSDVNPNFPTYPDMTQNLTGDEEYAGTQIDRDIVVDTTKEQVEVLAGTLSDLRVTVSINQNCTNAGALTIDAVRDHVATAAGFGTTDPGSRVHIIIAPFDEPIDPAPGASGIFGFLTPENSWILYAAIGGLVLFVILLVVIIVLARRRRKKRLAQQKALEEEMLAAEAAAEAAAIIAAAPPTGGADIMEVNTEKSMELRKTVRQFAQNNPEIAAQMVRAWLKGEESGNG